MGWKALPDTRLGLFRRAKNVKGRIVRSAPYLGHPAALMAWTG